MNPSEKSELLLETLMEVLDILNVYRGCDHTMAPCRAIKIIEEVIEDVYE